MAKSRYLVRDGQWLQCYSPGDGAMMFSWVMEERVERHRMGTVDGRRRRISYMENSGRQVCSGRPVTVAHVRAFLRHSDGKHFARGGWKLYRVNTQLRLVGPVKRIDANTVELARQDDEPASVITYTLDPTYIHEREGGRREVGFHAIKATFVDPTGTVRELKLS